MGIRSDLLVRLAGARVDLLSWAPRDRATYTFIGATMLGTGVLASVSAAFALSTVFRNGDGGPTLPLPVMVIVGILWGAVIVNLNRMLVVSIVREDGRMLNTMIAIPRLGLAILLGTVISTPLVMEIFRPEIDVKVQQIIQQDREWALRGVDEQFRYLAALQAKVDETRAAAAAALPAVAADDADVKQAGVELAAAQAAVNTAQTVYQQELDGTGGSGVAGEGPATREKRAALQNRIRERDAAKANLDTITAAVAKRLDDSASIRQQQAAAALPGEQTELDRAVKAKADAVQRVQESAAHSDGLINRLRALGDLTDTSGLGLVWLAVLLFFAAVEVLPVLVKVISLLGAPTLYDGLTSRENAEAEQRAEAAAARRRQELALAAEAYRAEARFQAEFREAIVPLRRERVLSAEREDWNERKQAGVREGEEQVKKLEERARTEIGKWVEATSKKADDEFDAWLAARFTRDR